MNPPTRPALLPLLAALFLSGASAALAQASAPLPTPTAQGRPFQLPPAEAARFAVLSHVAVDGVAEIVAATPDGQWLFYTSADAGRLGVVDLRRPEQPRLLAPVDVRFMGVGEPTSVAVSPDGRFAVLALRLDDDRDNPRRGLLRVYDVRNPEAIRHVKDITVGIGPDSLALVGQGRQLRAVVAIEDEESDAKGDATLGGRRPGRIDVVGLQDLYGGASSGLQSIGLVDALRALSDAMYPEDPQPEFVAVRADGHKAVVSLQENNAIAVLDLSNPRQARLERVFSAGMVRREGSVDLRRDGEIRLDESATFRREPDAVAWVDQEVIALANEGDGKRGPDGIWPGGRGFTLMDLHGRVVFETGDATERHAVTFGHYPDARSAAKGVEIEGVASARMGGRRYLFVGSERGSFIEVHDATDARQPRAIQLLPTGMSPEGLATITGRADGRALLVAANEGDGSLTVFEHHAQGAPANPREPQLRSTGPGLPWGALSGLTTDGRHLYAVPDNAFGQSRIFRIDPSAREQGQMVIDRVTLLREADGRPLKADPEGIARIPGGFWIASEGKTVADNELLRVDDEGTVRQRVALPARIQALFADPRTSTGFEGVAVSPDGQTLYLALQRGYDLAKPQAALLKYHLPTESWTSALYPLDQHSRNPRAYWTGLSEIQLTEDGRLLLLERDKGGGEGRAIHAEIKRVYSVRADELQEGAVLRKTLVKDLRRDHGYLIEKAEGMVVFQGDLWVVNDNDGAGWTRMLNTGKP